VLRDIRRIYSILASAGRFFAPMPLRMTETRGCGGGTGVCNTPLQGGFCMPKKGVTFNLRGLAEVQKGFNRALKNIKHRSTEATTDNVLDLCGEAVKQTPVDTGALRGSGYGTVNGVRVAKGKKDGSIKLLGKAPDAEVSYGRVGFGEIYAVTQHELKQNHPKGGNDKYLENPFKEGQNRYLQRYKDGVGKGCKD